MSSITTLQNLNLTIGGYKNPIFSINPTLFDSNDNRTKVKADFQGLDECEKQKQLVNEKANSCNWEYSFSSYKKTEFKYQNSICAYMQLGIKGIGIDLYLKAIFDTPAFFCENVPVEIDRCVVTMVSREEQISPCVDGSEPWWLNVGD